MQRISTLAKVFGDKFEFAEFEKLTLLNGKIFKQIPEATIRKLKARSLRIIVLSDSTPKDVRSDLFYRLNTNQMKTKNNETRSALHIKFISEIVARFFAFSENYLNFEHRVKAFVDDLIRDIVKGNK